MSLTHDHDVVHDQDAAPRHRPGPVARLLLVPIHVYRRWISPVLPPTCRFEPSCSAYAVEALTTHGALRGTWLTVYRLGRCAPWGRAGYDPVPPRRNTNQAAPTAAPTNDDRDGSGTPCPARETFAKE